MTYEDIVARFGGGIKSSRGGGRCHWQLQLKCIERNGGQWKGMQIAWYYMNLGV